MDKLFLLNYRNKIQMEVGKVVLGKSEQIDLITVCHLCGGHILFEDIPGTGKTLLLKPLQTLLGVSLTVFSLHLTLCLRI